MFQAFSANLTTYSYDIHGNVDTLVQQYRKGMMASHGDNRFKVMTYQYDLISGKVNQVHYQPGEPDQYYHRYAYDAENRITDVYTTTNKALIGSDVLEDHEAFYSYYKHGPLARTILGQQQVQGIDYAYTLQGWLKGVNAMALDTAIDMGRDGGGTITARDAYGFQLNYFTGDYKPANTSRNPFPGHSAYIGSAYRPLYNGNISSMGVNIGQLNQPQLYNYEYDQLNRLVSMGTYRGFNGNSWNGITATSDHQEQITYDGNGNITAYLRNGNTSAGKPLAMDNLGYHYKDSAGIRLSNQLIYVSDAVTANANYTEDIDGHTDSANYHYDQIGNLTHDTQEKIDSIEWNVYGKIAQIWKENSSAVGNLQRIRYSYDASGNRISKTVYSNQDAGNYKAVHTWYVRDASGNVMATYTSEDIVSKSTLATGTLGKLYLSELHMYGSSRLGIWNRKVDMDLLPGSGGAAPLLGSLGIDTFNRGNKFFELANHLGNVLVTVSDRKVGQNPVSGVYSSYSAEVVSASDYAPFGMQMVGRTFSAGAYRYGFNGKELDKEIASTTTYDYGFRIYNPALARFLSVDPLTKSYPWYAPYHFAGNKPIWAIDIDGLEDEYFHINIVKNGIGDVSLRNVTKKSEASPSIFNRSKPGPLGYGQLYTFNIQSQDMDGVPIGTMTYKIFVPRQSSIIDDIVDFFQTSSSSSSSKIGYVIYGKGTSMEWDSDLEKAAKGSETVNIGGWIDLVGGLREGVTSKDALQDLIISRKILNKPISNEAENVELASDYISNIYEKLTDGIFKIIEAKESAEKKKKEVELRQNNSNKKPPPYDLYLNGTNPRNRPNHPNQIRTNHNDSKPDTNVYDQPKRKG